MLKLSNTSIRTKLILIMTITAISAMLLITVAMMVFQYRSIKHAVEGELTSLASVIAWNCAPALAFNDVQTANESLAVLSSRSDIVAGYLYNNKGLVFAQSTSSQGVTPPLGSATYSTHF